MKEVAIVCTIEKNNDSFTVFNCITKLKIFGCSQRYNVMFHAGHTFVKYEFVRKQFVTFWKGVCETMNSSKTNKQPADREVGQVCPLLATQLRYTVRHKNEQHMNNLKINP